MPVVYSQSLLDAARISINPVDLEGCRGCPAHENGAYSAKFFRGDLVRYSHLVIDGPSVGEFCHADRRTNGGKLTCYEVKCVRIEADR